eukprot:Platyproteum_vivax@DN6013_c1_g1_i1.p1
MVDSKVTPSIALLNSDCGGLEEKVYKRTKSAPLNPVETNEPQPPLKPLRRVARRNSLPPNAVHSVGFVTASAAVLVAASVASTTNFSQPTMMNQLLSFVIAALCSIEGLLTLIFTSVAYCLFWWDVMEAQQKENETEKGPLVDDLTFREGTVMKRSSLKKKI